VKKPIAIILISLAGIALAQFRPVTDEEHAFDRRVTTAFDSLLTAAARKMEQPWQFKFEPGYHGWMRDEIDCPHLPHELRFSISLFFPGESEQALALELEQNRYCAITDSLAALGLENTMENPWDRAEIYVDVVVNYYALSDGAAIDTTVVAANQRVLHDSGAVFGLYESYPGSSDRPTSRYWFGAVPLKDNPASIPHYDRSRPIRRTDVRNVILTIHTARNLAREFYRNLDVRAIKRVIAEL